MISALTKHLKLSIMLSIVLLGGACSNDPGQGSAPAQNQSKSEPKAQMSSTTDDSYASLVDLSKVNSQEQMTAKLAEVEKFCADRSLRCARAYSREDAQKERETNQADIVIVVPTSAALRD